MRFLRMIGILALALAAAFAAQNGRGKAPGAGPRMVNPESVAARLMLATPQQRERALALLPPARQEQIRKQLQWFDGLPKAQQDAEIQRLERFAGLPPDQQIIVRLRLEALAKLPPVRRQAIRRALMILQTLPPPMRAARMNNPAFKARFSPEEQKIIEDLSDAWLLPPADAPPQRGAK